MGVGVPVGVSVVQTVDIAEQDQQVGVYRRRYDSGQGVVLADGVLHAHLVGGHGVVLVDNGQRAQLQQPENGVAHVAAALLAADILAGEQHLRHRVVVFVEQLVVGVHQLALTHGGCGLLGGHVRRAAGQIQLTHAHADGAGGHQNDLVPGIFQVTEHLAQRLHPLDIQPPGGVRQRGGADLYGDTHIKTLLRVIIWSHYTTKRRRWKVKFSLTGAKAHVMLTVLTRIIHLTRKGAWGT